MRIALAQIEVVPGQPKKNLERILDSIEDARIKGANLVALPEMCVGGYLLGDRWLEDDFCLDLMEYNEEILKASAGIAVAYGNIFLHDLKDGRYHPNKDGRSRKYNAVYVVQDGKVLERKVRVPFLPDGVQPKTLLPNYRFFDDERYFFSLQDVAKDQGVEIHTLLQPFMIDVDGKKIPVGFELCEDLWCEDYRKGLEALNPTKMLIENGAELVVNLSASPWTFGKNRARDRRVEFLKTESGERFVPFLYVNCTGAQNNGKNVVTFDGGSTAYNANGLPVKFARGRYDEDLMILEEKDLEARALERPEEPMIAQKYRTIIEGIRHMKNIRGSSEQPRYVIGLSGGIDSAVVAALLVMAVGRDRVLGINMPTIYNSDKTKNAAEHIARKLGITYEVVPIQEMVDLNEKVLESVDADGRGRRLSSLNKENIQAKIRGTSILSNIAAKYGAIFTNNGNKLEICLGYATLYGDVNGAIAPIGDLTKTEVVELAKYLNREVFGEEVIPEVLIPDELFRFRKDQIQPSAELKDDQIDPMKFGYHCALISAMTNYMKRTPEDIMRWYLDGSMERNLGVSTELLRRWKIDDPKTFVEDLEWFTEGINRSVFKRVQTCPIIVTSKSSYGYDIRESMLPHTQTREYQRLRGKVLGMKEYARSAA